ncbi:hypothetical protein KC939_00500 [Candidatus Saccharibacteria bacterium]|nr:hypothetical protein [Candidatus Saccharibacteria bacterium]
MFRTLQAAVIVACWLIAMTAETLLFGWLLNQAAGSSSPFISFESLMSGSITLVPALIFLFCIVGLPTKQADWVLDKLIPSDASIFRVMALGFLSPALAPFMMLPGLVIIFLMWLLGGLLAGRRKSYSEQAAMSYEK